MELRTHPTPYKFMPAFERFEPLVLDHTAIISAKACERKYFFQIVLGFTSTETTIYFSFGGAYHKFREVLEESKGDFVKAVAAAQKYWKDSTKGQDVPIGTKFDFMTEERLLQSCAVAFRHWQKEKTQGKIEVIMVEQPFNVEIRNGEFTGGRFDQVVKWNGRLWGRDFKTSSKEGMFFQRGLDPNDQFTRYTYAESKLCGQQVQGQIIEVLYNTKKLGPTITQYLASRTKWQLDDWEADEMFVRETLNRARTEDRWPKREVSCSFCQFHSVCKMPSESAQMAKLKAEFKVRPWNFMTVHLVSDGD